MSNVDQQTAHELAMARINNSVATIRNIDSEDFTHSYAGVPYTLRAGEQLPFPYPVGMLLAQHLAMKMARNSAKRAGKLTGNDDKKSVQLYTGSALRPYLDKIIVSTIERPAPVRQTEAEIMRQKTEEIRKEFPDQVKPAIDTVDKKDIVKLLKERGVKFNPRATKEELLQLVTESEMQGGGNQE